LSHAVSLPAPQVVPAAGIGYRTGTLTARQAVPGGAHARPPVRVRNGRPRWSNWKGSSISALFGFAYLGAMPKAPLPPELERFVRAPRPAVVATVRPDGSPATTASWYDWEDGGVLLSIVASSPRARNLRNDPRLSLTILGKSWYHHVSLLGRVIELRDDPELADLDRLSQRYFGKRYPNRELRCLSAVVEVERWHSFGDPGDQT
jgi:PPOX class probable F420-dependent enzyme